MKTKIFEHKGSKYWAEMVDDKKATSNYTHFIHVFREGEKKPIISRSAKGTEPLMTTIYEMIDSFNNQKHISISSLN